MICKQNLQKETLLICNITTTFPPQPWHIGHNSACHTCGGLGVGRPWEWKVKTINIVLAIFFLAICIDALDFTFGSSVLVHGSLSSHLSQTNPGTEFFWGTWKRRLSTAWPGGLKAMLKCSPSLRCKLRWICLIWIHFREVAMQPVLNQQKLKALVYYIEVTIFVKFHHKPHRWL